jgi:integrase
MKIRNTFPKVYKLKDSKSQNWYWMVDARSKRWGLAERKSFSSEKDALEHARAIAEQVAKYGAQPNVPEDVKRRADEYGKLVERLMPYSKTPEDAVTFYLSHLGTEILRQAKPPIKGLTEKWQAFKFTDTTLSNKTKIEIRSYARFIRSKWGTLKPDDLKKNEIDLLLRGLKISNNTRRKYLRYIRMFFAWVRDEHIITANPTDGIFYKPDDFNADFYDVSTTKHLLRHVVDNEKDLIGYYALLTFAGLRPSEGARVQWQDYNAKVNELYVRKGKTNARHIILEPVAVEWMKYHREHTAQGKPFIDLYALDNREKRIREAVLNGEWIQDGLRHGFATYYKSKIQSIEKTADYMGNSMDVVKRHYQRTIPADECLQFWSLNPENVLKD